jgi:hypothetical protein
MVRQLLGAKSQIPMDLWNGIGGMIADKQDRPHPVRPKPQRVKDG